LVDDKNVVVAKKINPIKSIGSDYAVSTDIESGERLIISGYQKVRPGVVVNPQPWKPNK
jgi:membrane fusion protein (multidrug efflux system)